MPTRLMLPALLFPVLVSAQERSVALKDAPRVVMRNVMARFPDATVAGVSRDTEDGELLYEVTLKRNGRTIDVTTTPAGRLTLIEREIAAGDLPAPVSALLRSKYPGATYTIVEEVTRVGGTTETLAFYEVLLKDTTARAIEVQVAPDGSRILHIEPKKAGEPPQ